MRCLDQKGTVREGWRTQESDDVWAKVSRRGTGHCDQGMGPLTEAWGWAGVGLEQTQN